MRGCTLAGRAIPTSELAWAKACDPGSIVYSITCQVTVCGGKISSCSHMTEACWKLEGWKAACAGKSVLPLVTPALPRVQQQPCKQKEPPRPAFFLSKFQVGSSEFWLRVLIYKPTKHWVKRLGNLWPPGIPAPRNSVRGNPPGRPLVFMPVY